MKLLALDAATEACSAALLCGDELLERYAVLGRGHAERLLPMIQELLAEGGLALRDLEAIAFGRGPGGFTGLRIAAGITQGLAFGANLPVLPVSNLAALALGASRDGGTANVLCCLDARMGEVYWSAYQCSTDSAQPQLPERLTDPGQVRLPEDGTWLGAGSGFAACPELAQQLAPRLQGIDATRLPHAGDIARLGAGDLAAGRAVPAELALPVYLRDNVVHRR